MQDKRKKRKTKNTKAKKEEFPGLLPPKVDRFEIRIVGAGGQGIISMGMLLGEAIAIGDGRNVAQSQHYGPEARGGATLADVVISDKEIYFPECLKPDLLVALTPSSYEYYAQHVKPEGLVIADSSAAESPIGPAVTITVPFIETSMDKFNTPIPANMIVLGFLSTYTRIVSKNAIKGAVEDKFGGSKYLKTNLDALEEGFKLGLSYRKKGILPHKHEAALEL